jgi:hypothetical protein
MKVIAVHLDDTLNNFTEVLQTTDFSFEPDYGLSEADFTRFITQMRAGLDEENNLLSTPFSFFKSCLYQKCYNLAHVRASAVLDLQRLKRDGCKICICTKRDLRRAIGSTKSWLNANHVPYDCIFKVPDLARFCRDWDIDMVMEGSSIVPSDNGHRLQNPSYLSFFEESAEQSGRLVALTASDEAMEAKLGLLKEFYSGLLLESVKVETPDFGWGFLNEVLGEGGELDYGEAAGPQALYKYKFCGLPEWTVDRLLGRHIGRSCNVCFYFSEGANDSCCINLDVNLKIYDNNIGVEMTLLVRSLIDSFSRLGVETLAVASGRGYHIWCRFNERISNDHLCQWMFRSAANAIREIYANDFDRDRIRAYLFPDPRVLGMASLRLFGTRHATTGMFSHVLAKDELLDESDSWKALQDYMAHRRVTRDRFYESYTSVVRTSNAIVS